jgi:hypothetical protein
MLKLNLYNFTFKAPVWSVQCSILNAKMALKIPSDPRVKKNLSIGADDIAL